MSGRSLVRRLLLAAGLVASLAGCQTASELGYYWQSVRGHWALMDQARPIADLLAEPGLDPVLRGRLEHAREIRRYASTELGLPDNGSYTEYVDLKRAFVVWNVVAAPEFSLSLRQWCFPFAGCVSYRGYYSEQAARDFAAGLRAQGLDVQVAGVPAYSTLGWLDDPLLSSFIGYSEPDLARLIFHELAHQLVYVKGDSTFNESFATAVEEVGVQRWLKDRGRPGMAEAYQAGRARRAEFLALLQTTRERLAALYAEPLAVGDMRARRRSEFEDLRTRYQALRTHWGGWAGYDRWFDQDLGNAHLGAVATYTSLGPGFRRLLAESEGDLDRFYRRVREIAELPKTDRDALLAP